MTKMDRTGNNKSYGDLGESLGRGYLRRCGMTILHAPFRCKSGDIDIIALDGNTLAFIEVKARRNPSCGRPVLAVTPAKQRRIARVARIYLAFYNRVDFEFCRFDVMGISTDKTSGQSDVEYIKDAFRLDQKTMEFCY